MALKNIDQLFKGIAEMEPVFFSTGDPSNDAGTISVYWWQQGGTLDGRKPSANTGEVLTYNMANNELRLPSLANNEFAHLVYFNAPTNGGLVYLVDRLWHHQFTMSNTSTQTVNSATWPARDNNGSSNGEGVFLMLEVVGGNIAPTVTIEYTNSDGVGGRTSTTLFPTKASASCGYPMTLQGSDKGVRSVQNITLSGDWSLPSAREGYIAAYRPLAYGYNKASNQQYGAPSFPQTNGMPRVWANTVLTAYGYPASTQGNPIFAGFYILAKGQ